MSANIVLRPYQNKAFNDVRAAYSKLVRHVLFVLVTGGGKTVLFCKIAQSVVEKLGDVLICAHRKELVMQICMSLAKMGIEHSIIAPASVISQIKIQQVRELGRCFVNRSAKVQVGSVQTIGRRLGQIREPSFIIIDESHHATAGQWRDILKYYKNARSLGVTGTPCRTDGQGLGSHVGGVYDAMVLGPSANELIALGNLVPPKVYMPEPELDISFISRNKDGELNSKQLEIETAKSRPTIIGDAVKWYEKFAKGERAVVFCISVEGARETARAFCSAGYKFACLDGSLDDITRREIVMKIGSGELDGITSCDLVSEGFDCPGLSVAIFMRRTTSLIYFLQACGRVLRSDIGKTCGKIIDMVGNVMEFGLPHWDREWSLDGGLEKNKRGDQDPDLIRPVTCPKCFCVHEPRPICPECQHVYVKKAREIEKVDGNLVEMTAQLEAELREKKTKKVEQGRAQSLGDLIRLEFKRGSKPGWAFFVFTSRPGNNMNAVKRGVEEFLSEINSEMESYPERVVELDKMYRITYRLYSAKLERIGLSIEA